MDPIADDLRWVASRRRYHLSIDHQQSIIVTLDITFD
jgi:hypothetical protein